MKIQRVFLCIAFRSYAFVIRERERKEIFTKRILCVLKKKLKEKCYKNGSSGKCVWGAKHNYLEYK